MWLSPRQVCVVPVSPEFAEYARDVKQRVWDAGFFADVDDSRSQFPKKIREAQVAQYNFILVVGAKEKETDTVNVRTRDNVVHGDQPVAAFIQELQRLKAEFK